METHHFSSQIHDLESCPLREENRQLKLELEAIKDLAQKTEGERQQHCADLMAADERIEELEAVISKLETAAPKWISVKDRLPYSMERVLVCTTRGTFAPATYSPLTNSWIEHGQLLGKVTHWMPLPDTPTTEDS